MADNVTLNSGSGGSTLWTDEVAGSKHAQVVKLADGTADSTTVIAAGGGVEASALRVTIASDSTGVVSIDDNGGAITVDGTVAATQSGTWNITNVSGTISLPTGAATQATLSALNDKVTACNTGAVVVSSSALPSGAATAAKQPALGTAGTASADVITVQGIAGATAIPVSDNGGSLTVDGTVAVSGSVAVTGTFWQATQPVSGTVTANAGTNLNTSALALEAGGNLAACATALGVLDNCISGSEAQVDVVAALPAGTNLLGKVSAGIDGTNLYDGTTALTIKRASGIATGSGANTMIAAVADKKIRVLALSLLATSTTAVSAYVYNGDYMLLGDGTNKLTLDMDGGGGPAGVVLPYNQGGWFQTDTNNEALAINLSGATPVIWCATYLEV